MSQGHLRASKKGVKRGKPFHSPTGYKMNKEEMVHYDTPPINSNNNIYSSVNNNNNLRTTSLGMNNSNNNQGTTYYDIVPIPTESTNQSSFPSSQLVGSSSVSYMGIIYLFGGVTTQQMQDGDLLPGPQLYVLKQDFNGKSVSWERVETDLPQGLKSSLAFHSASLAAGKMFVSGGVTFSSLSSIGNTSNSLLNDSRGLNSSNSSSEDNKNIHISLSSGFYSLDLQTFEWQTWPNIPGPTAKHTMACMGFKDEQKMMLFGGISSYGIQDLEQDFFINEPNLFQYLRNSITFDGSCQQTKTELSISSEKVERSVYYVICVLRIFANTKKTRLTEKFSKGWVKSYSVVDHGPGVHHNYYPLPRSGHTSYFDSYTFKLFIFGGTDKIKYENDSKPKKFEVWALDKVSNSWEYVHIRNKDNPTDRDMEKVLVRRDHVCVLVKTDYTLFDGEENGINWRLLLFDQRNKKFRRERLYFMEPKIQEDEKVILFWRLIDIPQNSGLNSDKISFLKHNSKAVILSNASTYGTTESNSIWLPDDDVLFSKETQHKIGLIFSKLTDKVDNNKTIYNINLPFIYSPDTNGQHSATADTELVSSTFTIHNDNNNITTTANNQITTTPPIPPPKKGPIVIEEEKNNKMFRVLNLSDPVGQRHLVDHKNKMRSLRSSLTRDFGRVVSGLKDSKSDHPSVKKLIQSPPPRPPAVVDQNMLQVQSILQCYAWDTFWPSFRGLTFEEITSLTPNSTLWNKIDFPVNARIHLLRAFRDSGIPLTNSNIAESISNTSHSRVHSNNSNSNSNSNPLSPNSSRHETQGMRVKYVGPLEDEAEGQLQKAEMIGEGSYGRVYKGIYLNQTVAIKELVGGAHLQKEFFHELAMMKKLRSGHPNVLKLLAYSDSPPNIYMVTEYIKGGSVDDNLLHLTKTNTGLVIHVLKDVSKGMQFLHSNNVVHRDLASRNVLIDYTLNSYGEKTNYVFKVCDFGYARLDMMVTNKTTTRMLPIKWSSPEGLKMIYGKPGDVWSWGNMAIELLLGKDDPFPKVTDQIDLGMLGKKIRDEGEHPERPAGCPDRLWRVLQRCWKVDMKERATFDELTEEMEKMEQELGKGWEKEGIVEEIKVEEVEESEDDSEEECEYEEMGDEDVRIVKEERDRDDLKGSENHYDDSWI